MYFTVIWNRSTVEPWRTWVWPVWVHSFADFFAINTVVSLYPRVLYPWIQPSPFQKQYFTFPTADSELRIKNSIFDPQFLESWVQRTTIVKVWGSQRSYMNFWLHGDLPYSCSRVNFLRPEILTLSHCGILAPQMVPGFQRYSICICRMNKWCTNTLI